MALKIINESVRVGTLAQIRAKDGAYLGQRAICEEYGGERVTGAVGAETRLVRGGARLKWVGNGWAWETDWQLLSVMVTARTAPADTAQNEIYFYDMPLLGSVDAMRMECHWDITSNANVKNQRLTLGTSGSMVTGMNVNLASDIAGTNRASAIMQGEFWNMNSVSSQQWLSNAPWIYGPVSTSPQVSTKNTGNTGNRFAVVAEKANAGDTMTLLKAAVWIRGGGLAI